MVRIQCFVELILNPNNNICNGRTNYWQRRLPAHLYAGPVIARLKFVDTHTFSVCLFRFETLCFRLDSRMSFTKHCRCEEWASQSTSHIKEMSYKQNRETRSFGHDMKRDGRIFGVRAHSSALSQLICRLAQKFSFDVFAYVLLTLINLPVDAHARNPWVNTVRTINEIWVIIVTCAMSRKPSYSNNARYRPKTQHK